MRPLALILTVLLPALTASAAHVPRPAPELVMERGAAPPLPLSQFRGKIIALAFGYTTCDHCQALTGVLNKIQKDYAARNVVAVECAFEEDVKVTYPMFLKVLAPQFPTGYTTAVAVKKFLLWEDKQDGMLMIPYMIFIDSAGVIRGDFSGKEGFFTDAEKNIRAQLDKMTKGAAQPAPKKK